MNVLIYTDPYEPITQILMKNRTMFDLKPIFVKDFIDHAEVFDEFDKEQTLIQWFLPSIGKITNSYQTFIINRAFFIPTQWYDNFHDEDRKYAECEFWSYLVFALSSFQNITEKPNFGNLTGGCLPLSHQWSIIKTQYNKIFTPEFYIGPLEFMPEELVSKVIFTLPYNFYYWKINECDENHKDNVFAILKPHGCPVLAFVVSDEEVCVHCMESNLILSSFLQEKIKFISKQLNQIFGYFSSEILFFIDNEDLTFGMIHNMPIASFRLPDFEAKIVKSIHSKIEAIRGYELHC